MAQARDAGAGTAAAAAAAVHDTLPRRARVPSGALIGATLVAALAVLAGTLQALDGLATRWDREDRVLLIRQAALADLDAIDAASGSPRSGSPRRSADAVRRELATILRTRGDDLARHGRHALASTASVVLLACLLVILAPRAWPARRARRDLLAVRPVRVVATADPGPRLDRVIDAAAPVARSAAAEVPARVAARGAGLAGAAARVTTAGTGSAAGLGHTAASARAAGIRMRSLLDRIGAAAALGGAATDTRPVAGKS